MNSILKGIEIRRAVPEDGRMLSDLGRRAFIESHGPSATVSVIEEYVSKAYTPEAFEEALSDTGNYFHVLYLDGVPAGYSKYVLNTECIDKPGLPALKLDRLYFVHEFYGKGLANHLFSFITSQGLKAQQSGIWLYVWTENHRAVRFYEKKGFRIVGGYNFQLTAQHANPNHCMWLDISAL